MTDPAWSAAPSSEGAGSPAGSVGGLSTDHLADLERGQPGRVSDDLADAVGRAILQTLDPGAESSADHHLAIVGRTAEAEDAIRALLRQAVGAARAQGYSWAQIGAELNLSRQAVQQRFGDKPSGGEAAAEERWLGPVTAFDELGELEIAGRLGWHTVEAGMLRHRMVRTDTQWEHKRVLWTGTLKRYDREGWQVGCRAFPWVYLIRDLGVPAPARAETQHA